MSKIKLFHQSGIMHNIDVFQLPPLPENRSRKQFAFRANDNEVPEQLHLSEQDIAAGFASLLRHWELTEKQRQLFGMMPPHMMNRISATITEEIDSMARDVPVPVAHGVSAVMAMAECIVGILQALPTKEAKYAHAY